MKNNSILIMRDEKRGKSMVKHRSVAAVIILTFITCGLYSIYWMYSVTEEVSYLTNDPSFTGGKVILFSLITCGIYTFFWYYSMGQKLMVAQQRHDKNELLLLSFFYCYNKK